jgi:putative transposase
MVKFKRSRTPSKYIYYALHLYFSGLLSLRKTSEHLLPFIKRNHHVSIWNWIQHYKPTKIWQKRTKISQFIIDETLIRGVGREVILLWIAIEPKSKSILDMRISLERSILVAEQFLQELIKNMEKIRFLLMVVVHGIHKQACRFLNLRHHALTHITKEVS